MPLEKAVIKQNPDLPSTEIHGEIVVMSSEMGRYYSLAHSAASIWKALEKPATIDEVCASLRTEYAVDEQTCHDDVTAFVSSLMNLNLILGEKT